MSELISGKDALIALANGREVENWNGSIWWDVEGTWQLDVFLKTDRKFRLKPRTITINGIEVPVPFEPKLNESFFRLNADEDYGYTKHTHCEAWPYNNYTQFGAWRTEEEIKQVVAALRQVFGGAK